MSTTKFKIEANGTVMGFYFGYDEGNALDNYAKDAGYRNYKHLAQEHGDDAEITMSIRQMDFSFNHRSFPNFDEMLKGIWEFELRKVDDDPEKELHELPGLENVSRADVEDIAATVCFDGQFHGGVEFPDKLRTKEEIKEELIQKFEEVTGIKL